MRVFLLVFGGLIAIVVVLGSVVFVVGRVSVQRLAHFGKDPYRARAVAAQIAHFHLPQGYTYSSSFDFVGSRTVSITSADGYTQFTLTGSDVQQDIGYLAWSASLNVRGCGGMQRLPDVRDQSNGRTFVSEIFKCRNKPYRIGFTRVKGRMTDTIVVIVAPPNDWPSHDLATLLDSIQP